MISTVIIFSGAGGKENGNILPHTTCILRRYFLLGFLEITKNDMMERHIMLSLFSFWYIVVAEVNAAKIKHQENSTLSLRKSSESEKIFPIQVHQRASCSFFFCGEPRESEAARFALGTCCQLWCLPARDTYLLLEQFFEGEESYITGSSIKTSFLYICSRQCTTVILSR